MKLNQLRQLIREEISKVVNENAKFELDPENEEVTISGFGEEYTATYDPEDENDKILFIHYFEDGEYHSEGDMPEIFEYLSKYGGETFIDDDEVTLSISLKNLRRHLRFIQR